MSQATDIVKVAELAQLMADSAELIVRMPGLRSERLEQAAKRVIEAAEALHQAALAHTDEG